MPQKQFYGFIGIATFTKLLMNVTRRMIYPFAPEFARGLGVPLSAITSVIAVNQATALLGPVGASLADRYGYKLLMLFGLGLLTVGTFATGLIPLYSVLVVCLFLAGLGKSIFDPTLQAFIGEFVPIEQRGKVIGITEFAWAGATLLGIPAAGLIIHRTLFLANPLLDHRSAFSFLLWPDLKIHAQHPIGKKRIKETIILPVQLENHCSKPASDGNPLVCLFHGPGQ